MTAEATNILIIAIAVGILASTFTVVNLMILAFVLKLYTEFFKQLAQEKRR